jgi:hypothetical protein
MEPMNPLPFEQQPRESNRAFAAFRAYLDLGPQRSLVTLGRKQGRKRSTYSRWCQKFDWPARVRAYTAHLALLERQTAEATAVRNGVDWAKRQEQQREEEWQTRTELLALAREVIARWKSPDEKNRLRCGSLEGIARLLDLASRLGRVSSGLSLDPAHNAKPAEEDAAYMIQIEVALDKIYGQPEAGHTLPPVTGLPPATGPASVVDVEEVDPKSEIGKRKAESVKS